MSDQLHSPESNDCVEQLREELQQSQLEFGDAVLDAAYDAGDIDTPMLFAYCQGELSAEERREIEAEAARSPHLLSKLTRIGRIVAEARTGGQARG